VCLHPTNTLTAQNHNQHRTAYFVARVPADPDFCSIKDHWKWNGCGPHILPDWLVDYVSDRTGFTRACNSHDVCFSNCGKSRRQCEDEFIEDMYERCGGERLCRFVANLFSEAATAGGQPFCFAARSYGRCTDDEKETCRIDGID